MSEAVTEEVEVPEGEAQPLPKEAKPESDPQDDLDTWLAEFAEKPEDSEPEPAPTKPGPEFVRELRDGVDTIKQFNAERVAERTRQALADSVESIRDSHEVLKNLPEDVIEGILHKRASDDPRFRNAFLAQFDNPKAWERIRSRIADELAEKMGSIPNQKVTEDVKAARAAVRGTSQIAPEEPQKLSNEEYSQMTPSQWEAHLARRRAGHVR